MTLPEPPGNQVVAPGEIVASDWGNAVWDQTIQRFDDIAARDAWDDPPDGAYCYTETPGAWYRHFQGQWRPAVAEFQGATAVFTTNASGGGVTSFVRPFPSAATSWVASSGDRDALTGFIVTIGAQLSNTECGWFAWDAGGGPASSRTIRIYWVAVWDPTNV